MKVWWVVLLIWVTLQGCAMGIQQQQENPNSACGPLYNAKNWSDEVGPYVCYNNQYYGYFASYFTLAFWPTADCSFCECCQ